MKEALVSQLKNSKIFLDKSTDVLTEEDSGITPVEGMMSAAQQVAHIAQTVDWFMDGVFGDNGFDMDFEGPAKVIMAVTSLEAAREWCIKSYDSAIATIESKSDEELAELLPADSIMGATPKGIALGGIAEHTAHHRGALTVYTRIAGKTPAMPYM